MTMLLDLRHLRGGSEPVKRQFEASAFDIPADDFRLLAPVALSAEVSRDETKVRLAGRVSTTLEMACSRCLDPFTVPVDAAFDLMFLPEAAEVPESEEGEITDDAVAVSYYKDQHIDLGDVVREQCYLAVPMKPLCRPDCLGLCPVCGNNRNINPCTCEDAWVDPRLEPLRKLTGGA